jgi:hypothetical protein
MTKIRYWCNLSRQPEVTHGTSKVTRPGVMFSEAYNSRPELRFCGHGYIVYSGQGAVAAVDHTRPAALKSL